MAAMGRLSAGAAGPGAARPRESPRRASATTSPISACATSALRSMTARAHERSDGSSNRRRKEPERPETGAR
jgi:hypothetical protein